MNPTILTNIIAFLAFFISFLSYIYVINNRKQSNSPLLCADKVILRMDSLKKGYYIENRDELLLNSPKCTLYRHSFLKKDGKQTNAKNSLILDSRCNKGNKPDKTWLRFSTITLRNVGYDLINLKLTKTVIYFSNSRRRKLILKPSIYNTLYYHIENGDTIKIDLSYIFDFDEYALITPQVFIV